MNWLYYLAEANAYLAVIYAIYYVALRRETFYQLNRVYLIAGSTLAFIMPLLQLGILLPAPEQMSLQIEPLQPGAVLPALQQAPAETNYLLWAYAIVAAVMLLLFFYKVTQLLKLAHKGLTFSRQSGFRLIEIDSKDTPAFSFFNYLFISTSVTGADTIIKHELVHIRQRHSWDVVYLELLKIINWFNPVVYLMQSSIKELHEYIADEELGQTRQQKNDYTDFLLSNAYGAFATSLTNNFFNKNLLKKRIIMLHKQRSGYLARLKYLMVIPVCGGMLCTSTLAFSKTYGFVDLMPQKDTLKLSKSKKVLELQPAVQNSAPEAITIKVLPSKKAKAATKVEKTETVKLQLQPTLAAAPAKAATPVNVDNAQANPAPNAEPVALKIDLVKAPEQLTIIEKPQSADTVYNAVEHNAQFPGGLSAFYSFLAKNVKYPEQARNAKQQGKVYVTFIVEQDGALSNIKVIKSLTPEIDAEAVRVMSTSPKWIPANQKGKAVRQKYTVPINFSLAAK